MLIFTIALRELRSLFLSPRAWAILAVVQILLSYLFLIYVKTFLDMQPQAGGAVLGVGLTDTIIAPLFSASVIILMLMVPLLTMSLISEERRSQTLTLLISAPLSMTEIILGKYLAIVIFMLIMLGMIALMPLSLLAGGSIDVGQFAGCILAVALLLASFAALGLFMSTLTNQPSIAAISTFGILLLLWMIDWAGKAEIPYLSPAAAYLSMLGHYQALLSGVFSSSDAIYYVLLIVAFLVLSVRRLDADRLQR